ncbi:hypothetical protein AUC69_03375 [Methyloceanibacter superfactus]|uniref:Uncharacterized protein n=1 Tax=Methyloceanibacter superfactus TaxID=1774969 RepID=A0A1E3VKZ8_9HYPH|nr:hypothetical protein AUC69_03375 [Methyloceanibacter superfactus]
MERVEIALAERVALVKTQLDLRVRRIDQALQDGNLIGVHAVDGLLGEAAEEIVHLPGPSMSRPP